MEDLIRSGKVTLDDGNQSKTTNQSNLSKEETDFYKLMFGDDLAAVRHRKLHCTACDIHIGSAPAKACNIFAHPVLLTLLCAECRKFYGDGNFEQGEDATDMFCRWCANGGNLYCCSYCSNTFCNKCIKRNFDPLVRKKIEDEEKWKCFVCDPTDLYTARAVCWALKQHIQTITRILKNDPKISKEELKEKMNLDESKCCSRKRSNKMKRRKLSGANGSEEEDETYHPGMEDLSLSVRRKILKKSLRAFVSKEEPENSTLNNTQSVVRPKKEIVGFNDDEDEDLPPPMIPCVQYMVEGDSSETLNATISSQSGSSTPQQTPHINPIPTANLLKITPPPQFTSIKDNFVRRKQKRLLQPILPALSSKFLMAKNSFPQNSANQNQNQNQNLHSVEYSPLPLRPPSLPPNVPMVSIPNESPSPRVHTVEYSSLPLRAPSLPMNKLKQTPQRTKIQKPRPASTSVKDVGVIEIGSDSDEIEVDESSSNDRTEPTVCSGRDILKNMLRKGLQNSSRFPELYIRRRGDKANNKVEEEIDLRTEEVRMLFKMIGTKLKKVPLLHLPNHNNLRSTRVKTRRFHLALTKAISTLADINDKVIHKYNNWRRAMLEESRQTRSSDNNTSRDDCSNSETTDDNAIPLDMICTNSESDSNNEDYDSDSMTLSHKVRNVKPFQERDTIDIAVGEPLPTADKSVQAFDVVEKDYEKCIGHSVLTKVEYDPADGSEILKPVIVPAEFNGKFEEQFIFYLQHREDNDIATDDDRGLPDPNETPLKDLIEANSPFVLEMLESIDSPVANGMSNEMGVEGHDESGKENEDRSEPTNVVKELAKMVTELSEDLKTNRNNETIAKKHSEHGKKDRRKQIFEHIESEVDIAVQALIDKDECSRNSSDNDETALHLGYFPSGCKSSGEKEDEDHITSEGKNAAFGYSEDECSIIE